MPNAQGGYTAEEEAEVVQRTILEAIQSSQPYPEERNPTPEEQAAQVERMIAGPPPARDGIFGALGYGFGPPYTPSPQDYNGTPLAPPVWGMGMESPGEGAVDWSHGDSYPSNWEDFHTPDNRSAGGGFFTAQDWMGDKPIPYALQMGRNLPSTNNYRLLPQQWQSPQFIMRNGRIIDMSSYQMYGPFGGPPLNEELSGSPWRSGAGVGFPAAWSNSPVGYAYAGWPGQLDPYSWHSPSMAGGS